MTTEASPTTRVKRRLRPTKMTPEAKARDDKDGFSHGWQVGNLVWTSAIAPRNETAEIVGQGDLEAQALQCLENIEDVLRDAGGTRDDVVKVTVYLADRGDRGRYLAAHRKFFKSPYPAVAIVISSVRPEFLVQIDAVGALSA